jgi:hypothetical protein
MDNCKRCKKSLGLLSGLFSDYCESCKNIIAQEKKSEQARVEREKSEKQRKQFEQFNKHKASLAKSKIQFVKNRIDNGEVLFLYQSVYLPVDSVVVEERIISEFTIAALRPLGFDGWDIVGIVPRTIGIGLTNSSYGASTGTTWGAGVGGNIVGVHVLLKKEISATHRVSDEYLEEYIKENISEFATQVEQQYLLDILSGTITLTPELEAGENVIQQNIAISEPKTEPKQKNVSTKVCPKCGISMPIKVANGGEKQGQSFYVCPNYQQCKQVYPVEG